MNEMRKLMEAVANPPQKLTEAPKVKYVWIYGDEDFEKVSFKVPATMLLAMHKAISEDNYEEEERLAEIVADKTNRTASRVFRLTVPNGANPDEMAGLKKVLAGGSYGFGETEVVAGYGPTKDAAKAAWEELQDFGEEFEDEDEWDF